MVYMIEKKYIIQDMNIELTSYIDNKQNIWFKGIRILLRYLVIVNQEMLLRDMYLRTINDPIVLGPRNGASTKCLKLLRW